MTPSQARHSTRSLVDLLVALVPVLAGLALYLPGGVASPLRWLVVALVVVSAVTWRAGGIERRRLVAAAGFGVPGLVVLLGGLVALVSDQRPVHLSEPIEFGLAIVAGVVAVALTRGFSTVMAVAWGWFGVSTLSALIGAWELITGHHLARYPAGQAYPKRYPGWNTIAAFQNNANLYAYLLVVSISVAPLLWVGLGRRWVRYLVPALVVINLFMLTKTQSKIGLATAAVVIASWVFAWRRLRYPLVIGAAVLLVGTWWLRWPGTHTLRQHLQALVWNIEKPGDSGWVRWRLIRSGAWMLEQTHGVGTGPGSFAERVTASPFRPPGIVNPHCALVEIGAQYGLLALMGWLAGLVALIVWAMRRVPRRSASRWSMEATVRRTLITTASVWPLLSMTHSTWLDQPITLAHIVTIAVLVGALVVPRTSPDGAGADVYDDDVARTRSIRKP